MAGRRDGPSMRDNSHSSRCKSRVTATIAIGIFLGCLSSFLFPKGFLLLNSASSLNRRLVDSISQVGFAWNSCESSDTISLLKSEFIAEQDKSTELKKQIRELTEKLRFAEQEKGQSQKQVELLGLRSKPGPFGSVKSSQTNPTIVPDYSVNPKLAELLKRVAIENELIIVLANSNVRAMLSLWYENVRRVGVKNFLVVALDSETARLCESEKVPFHELPEELFSSSAVRRAGGNHAVSGLKFRVLRQFLELGYSVLLSDVDIVYLQNPFEHLRRDSDIESMTDGHDNRTAYGFDDVSNDPLMGWARYAHTIRHWVFNSGFFYIRPTVQAIELLDRVAARLARDSRAWDQAVFNEELFYPSRPGYEGLYASRRVLDFYEFMNSKVLFKTVRKDPKLRKLKPVIVHVNYHPDKLPRMRAVVDFYVNGKQDALDSFSVGSE